MRYKSFYVLSEAANFIMIFAFDLCLVLVAQMAMNPPMGFMLPAILLASLAFSYATRNSVKNILLYFLFHIIFGVVLFFLPIDSLTKSFALAIFVVNLIFDIRYWPSARTAIFGFIPITCAVAPCIGYLVASIFHFDTIRNLYFAAGLVFIFMYYVRLFFESAYLLAIEKRQNEKMPLKDMIKNDSKLAIPFVVISMVIMFLSKFDAIDSIIFKIYLFIAGFVGKAIRFIMDGLDYLINRLLGDAEDVPMTMLQETYVAEETNSPVINIISIIVYLFLAFVVIFIIVKIIIAIVKSFLVKSESHTQTYEEEDTIEIRENIVKENRRKKVKLSKMRKLYKKTIEKKSKEGYQIQKYHTPRERAEDIKIKMKADVSALNEAYERERYGQLDD